MKLSRQIIYLIIFYLSIIPAFAQVSYWEPAEPESGDSITIYYDAELGTIPSNTAQLKLHWGINQAGAGGWVQPPRSMWTPGTIPWNDGAAVQSPMTKNNDDLWEITIQTEAATVSLHYVVTNGDSWDNNGSQNWDIFMGEPPARDMTWHTFYYDTRSTYAIYSVANIETIVVAGSFNEWSQQANPLDEPNENGVYQLDVHLPAGETIYKFVINGDTWVADPDNPHFDGSQYGNSIITLVQRDRPSFWNILPKSGTIYEPGDEFTVSGTIRPADTGGELYGNARLHFGEDVYDLTFSTRSGAIDPLVVMIPDDIAQDRYELSVEVIDDHDSITVHNVPIGVYAANTGFHYVDASGDDDGYGSFINPVHESGESFTNDILSMSISEAGGGDSLKFSIQMGEGYIKETALLLVIRTDLLGLISENQYSNLEITTPKIGMNSYSFSICDPQSPNFQIGYNENIKINTQLLDDYNLFEFCVSVRFFEFRIGKYNEKWIISLLSYFKSMENEYGTEVPEEFGGIDEDYEPDVWDLLFTDSADLQHRLLGNFSPNRTATLDNFGRGFKSIELSAIGDNVGTDGIWVELLTKSMPTTREKINIWGVVHSDYPVNVRTIVNYDNENSYLLESVVDTFSVEIEFPDEDYFKTASVAVEINDVVVYTSPVLGFSGIAPWLPVVISSRIEGNRVFLSLKDSLKYFSSQSYMWRAFQRNPQPTWILNPRYSEISFIQPSEVGEYYIDFSLRSKIGNGRARKKIIVYPDSIDLVDIDDSPKWVKEAIVYEIFPRSYSASQSLTAITDDLERIADLGVNTIWLMPIYPGPTDHGYEIVDYFGIEEDLGNEEEFRKLVNRAHELGLKVILDMVINHSSIQHPFMRDAFRYGNLSPYWDWYERNPDGSHKFYYDWNNLPNLNFDNPDVRNYFIEMSLVWVSNYDIDGFRCDVAWGPQERNSQFWVEWRTALKSRYPDLLLLGEASSNDWGILNDRFDLAYDWALHHEGVTAFDKMFERPTNLDNLHQLITNYGVGWPDHKGAFRFIENHDEQRFIDFNTVKQTKLAATLLFTIPGVPMIYAGQEIGEKSQRGLINWGSDPDSLLPFYKSLTRARKNLPALVYGNVERLRANQSMIYVMGRYTKGEARVVVAANFMSNPLPNSKIYIPVEDWGIEPDSIYIVTEEISGDVSYMRGHEIDTLSTYLDAYTARIFSIADSVLLAPRARPEPFTYYLSQCYPNPFNHGTIINFGIADASEVSIIIYDVAGREVTEIVNRYMNAGNHSIYWNGESAFASNLPSGIYLYKIKSANFTSTKKMIMLK